MSNQTSSFVIPSEPKILCLVTLTFIETMIKKKKIRSCEVLFINSNLKDEEENLMNDENC